ncbi:MAG: thioesterase family protein [Actinomycetota bacterium]|nr:thioesterase family protein [Actinomycetota bacterium]
MDFAVFSNGTAIDAVHDLTGPLRLYEATVPAEWIDYNGHMNDSRFFQVTSEAGDCFLGLIGMDANYLAGGHSYFTVESHTAFAAQAKLGDRLFATIQLLGHDDKRLHLFVSVHRSNDGSLVATGEHMMLHVDTSIDRAVPAGPAILAKLADIAAHHSQLPTPAPVGRFVGAPRT